MSSFFKKEKIKTTASAENTAAIKFIRNAILETGMNEKSLPSMINRGYPGGCATPIVYAAVIISPESPTNTVGQMVRRYPVIAKKKQTAGRSFLTSNLVEFI